MRKEQKEIKVTVNGDINLGEMPKELLRWWKKSKDKKI